MICSARVDARIFHVVSRYLSIGKFNCCADLYFVSSTRRFVTPELSEVPGCVSSALSIRLYAAPSLPTLTTARKLRFPQVVVGAPSACTPVKSETVPFDSSRRSDHGANSILELA